MGMAASPGGGGHAADLGLRHPGSGLPGHGELTPFTYVGAYDGTGAAIALPIDDAFSSVAGEPFIGNSSIGGLWYTGITFPQPFQNVYFHVDFGGLWIKAFEFDEQDELLAVNDFATALGNIVQLGTDPDQTALYYLTYHTSPSVHRAVGAARGRRTGRNRTNYLRMVHRFCE